ncbi:glycosyltransferase [Paenibacillus aurantiacus]|uniref:Glycosyltransferase n=1 Tax=Paenibacillus aurantiacus TaxID=1936118 RepID=A0ABV5KIK6_9BACL
MKKRLLFVTQYLHTGGAEKSLLTLLGELDYGRYDVDLLLFDHSGALFPLVPKQVNVLPPLFETFTDPLSSAVPKLLKRGRYRLLAGRALASAAAKFAKGKGVGVRWSIYRHALPARREAYDAAISYLDFHCNYYVAEKVRARTKILYNHMDYGYSEQQGWPCPPLERASFAACDYIVTVADSAKASLARYFPDYAPKMRVIHNRVSAETVRAMAGEVLAAFQKPERKSGITVATVARLGEEKGVRLALEACALLVRAGADVRWYLVGDGLLRGELEAHARELGLTERFILLGELANPYPVMDGCDIYVQPSLTEAHCIAVEEALALAKPVVVTDIPSFRNQIENGVSGVIAPASAEGLADAIGRLAADRARRESLQRQLRQAGGRHPDELKRFYSLIEGGDYEKVT